MKSSLEKLESPISNKKSPNKISISPNVTTRSRSSLNLSNPDINLNSGKQEIKIENDGVDQSLNSNFPSANSSDFSVVYVDDSDDTNFSQEVVR